MKRLLPPILVVLAAQIFAGAAVGQTEAPPRRHEPRFFLPLNFNATARFDLAAIREAQLLDLVERSPAALLLGKFEDEFGFALDDLDLVQFGLIERFEGQEQEGFRPRQETWILQGSEAVSLQALLASGADEDATEGQLGGVPALVAEHGSTTWLGLGTGTLVHTDIDWAEQVLAGQAKGGVPDDELMEIAVWPGRPLIALGGSLPPRDVLVQRGLQPIPPAWLDHDDLPRALRIRFDLDGGQLVLGGLIRFESGDAGPHHFDTQLTEWFTATHDDPQLQAMGMELGTLETAIEGRDLRFRLGLGAQGKAILALAQFAVLQMRRVEQVQAVEIAVDDLPATEPADAPVPAEKPADGGKRY